MGKNIIFDAYVKYSDGMEENAPIPGGEEGVRLNCFFKFLNLIELQVKDITVDIFIAQKITHYYFYVLPKTKKLICLKNQQRIKFLMIFT